LPSLRKKEELRPSQVFMARQIIKRQCVFLAAEMGVGKTAAALTAALRLLYEGAVRYVLIVAPLYVAENTWPEEINEWEHLRRLDYVVVTGTPKQRLKALHEDHQIYIINRENVAWLYRTLKKKDWKFDMLIYDESSRLKSGKYFTTGGEKKTSRLSEFGSLARVRHKFDYVCLLTGTPAPKGIIDLWGQAYICDGGQRLGPTKSSYLERYFDSDYMGWKFTPKPWAEDAVMDKLSDIMVSMRTEDYVDLPPVVSTTLKVDLSSKIMREYRQFERDLVSDAYDVEACSRGVLTNKLLQFANGSMYRMNEDFDPPKRELVRIHDAKISALESVMNEAGDEPVLLAYGFKFDIKQIKRKFPKAVTVDEDPNWKRKWDKGRIPLLLAHPGSVGHGLNMQYGGFIQCWYGLTWSLEYYQQFNKRLQRSGQKADRVFIHHIVANGTVDETVLSVMTERGATQDKITERVRARVLTSAKN